MFYRPGNGSGGGGGDHATLINLDWPVAGHTALAAPGSLASFDGAGSAALVTGAAQGDLTYFDGTVWTVLSPGAPGEILVTQGPGLPPIWSPAPTGDHSALTNLDWLAAGHTAVATPGSLASFDGAGAADLIAGVVQGDLLYFNGTTWVVFAPGVPGEVLSTQGPGLPPVWSPTGGVVSLQAAYAGGNTIVTGAGIPIAFTLTSGAFTVQGPDAVAVGNLAPVSTFTVASVGVQGFTSGRAETLPGFTFAQTGAGGDSIGLFVGTSDPNGVVTGDPGSIFRRDTGTGAESYTNVSSGAPGTDWALDLTERNHQTLLQLIHFIDEGPASGFATGATKTVTGGAFPTEVLWRRADTTALVRQTLIYVDVYPVTVIWRMYAPDGVTVLGTVTDTITYAGPFETGRVRAIT